MAATPKNAEEVRDESPGVKDDAYAGYKGSYNVDNNATKPKDNNNSPRSG